MLWLLAPTAWAVGERQGATAAVITIADNGPGLADVSLRLALNLLSALMDHAAALRAASVWALS